MVDARPMGDTWPASASGSRSSIAVPSAAHPTPTPAPRKPAPAKPARRRRAAGDEDSDGDTSDSSSGGEDVSQIVPTITPTPQPAPRRTTASASAGMHRPAAQSPAGASAAAAGPVALPHGERLRILQLVKEGKLTQAEAIEKMQEAEKNYQKTYAVTHAVVEDSSKKKTGLAALRERAKELTDKALAMTKKEVVLPPVRIDAAVVNDPTIGFGFLLGGSSCPPVVDNITFKAHCRGLRRGDVLAEINGVECKSLTGLKATALLEKTPVSFAANLVLYRKEAPARPAPPKADALGTLAPAGEATHKSGSSVSVGASAVDPAHPHATTPTPAPRPSPAPRSQSSAASLRPTPAPRHVDGAAHTASHKHDTDSDEHDGKPTAPPRPAARPRP